MKKKLWLLGLILLCLLAWQSAAADETRAVGEVAMDNDGAPAAQKPFHYGLAQLHNFEYAAAARAFRRAQSIDPDFALAYWGEAMTHNHPIWMQQDREAGLGVLARFAPTPAARQEKASSELAQDLIGALDVLFGEGKKQDRDDAYAARMGELYAKYPDNVDVASLYALSLMGTAHEGRHVPTYMKSAAITQRFFSDYPKHPGVLHYLIHATDDPDHAPLGLDAANVYGQVAPNAAHAQHMTSHIFLALGDWDGVIRANQRATDIINTQRARRDLGKLGCGHYPSWLMYGHLQQGDHDAADAIMQRCFDNVDGGGGGERTRSHFAWQRALYLHDTGAWTGPVAAMTIPYPEGDGALFEHRVTDGWIAVKTGELDAARAALAEAELLRADIEHALSADSARNYDAYFAELAVEATQLAAAIDLASGAIEAGLAKLREAVVMERSVPHGFGPPDPPKPSLELLAEALLEAGKRDEAIATLETSLARTPGKRATLELMQRARTSTSPIASAR